MNIIILAGLVAMATAWTPGLRDECNRVNVDGGSLLLPHERYCQLYYACDLEGNQTPLFCPGNMLFAYGIGIAVCVTEGFSQYNCPKWQCSSAADIGRRFPDTCCGKYWECTAPQTYSPKVCNPGTRFDANSESCQVNAICTDNEYCVDNIRSSNINDCRNTPSPTGDQCLYRTEGWPDDRQCPVGTAYDTSTCSCSQFNEGCTASGLSAAVLLENKNPDVQCRASGRLQFGNGQQLTTVSDKLNRNIDHYFYMSQGFSSNSLEGVFDNSNGQQPFIYDYYYNDNTLYAPLAITMTVRFDFNNINLNTVYNLLENRWTTDNSNTHCNPVTLQISARYNGISLGDRSWEFGIRARGENGVDSTGTANIVGNANDYFRVVFTFGTRSGNSIGIGGTVSNRGQSGQISSQTVNFITDNRSMGSALLPNKCGFAIGRSLSGRIREFSVYEGCSSFSTLG